MPATRRSLDDHLFGPGPKRILALDGGGLRGIMTLGFLGRIEDLLRKRYDGGDDFRLCDYFDLIAGTSTGAIIAAALARGMSVREVADTYMQLGHTVFTGSWLRQGLVRARYETGPLADELKRVLGEHTTLGDESLLTGLLIVTKRLDTGSPWPLGNNPKGRYFRAPEGASWISNADYPLWRVVRASTAAPSFFEPETLEIIPGSQDGLFVDGGVSPHNNPSLIALMYATLEGFGLGWPTGAHRLSLTSVGTGAGDPGKRSSRLAAIGAVQALSSLMDDCGALVETMLQWASSSSTAQPIDREIGDLRQDLLGDQPLVHYHRYQVDLSPKSVKALLPGVKAAQVETLSDMDKPENLDVMRDLGIRSAAIAVKGEHLTPHFDLRPSASASGPGERQYRRRDGQRVTAVQLALQTEGLSYQKWGAEQRAKPGDWLVNNDGEVYTVDQRVFEKTYRSVSAGRYQKVVPIRARVAAAAGSIQTQEGETNYEAGDYIVYNDDGSTDGYAISKARFLELYEPADG